MEMNPNMILFIGFILLVIVPAVVFLFFLDKFDPKRKKAKFLANRRKLPLEKFSILGFPIKLRYLVAIYVVIVILDWLLKLPFYVYFVFILLLWLIVKKENGKKRK
jgi:phosphatidylglycerophosphate synthase